MKKYYIVITPFFPTPDKFYGSYIYDQVAALKRQGKYILVLRPFSGFTVPHGYCYNDFNVSYFQCLEMPSYILNGLTDGINRLLFKKFWKNHFGKDFDVEAVHCHTSQCALYGNVVKEMFPQCTSIIQYHDLDPFTILNGCLSNKKWNLLYKIRKTYKKLEKFDVHVAVSKRVEENLLSFPKPSPREQYEPYLERLALLPVSMKPLKVKKSVVLINGVDTTLFYNRKQAMNNSNKLIIGCIGNYIKLKRHKCLIKAIGILKKRGITDVLVRLVGNNPPKEYQEIKHYVGDCGLQDMIEFCPPYAHKDLLSFYESIDLFVLPSVFEGLGCVFLEAWACGVPFISCYNQGIDDLIDGEEKDLWLVIKDSPEDLADKIVKYKEKRYKQHLVDTIDIDVQIKRFLKKIELL